MFGAIKAERIKFLTLPSYVLSVLTAFAILIGWGMLTAFTRVRQAESADGQSEPFVHGLPVDGVQPAQILLAIVAVLFVTSEFTQTTVQTSVLSVPKRTPILVAKAATVACAGFLIGVVGSSVLAVVAPPILEEIAVGRSEYEPVRVILGCGLYLALIAVLSLSIGAIIRHVVGAVITVLALLTVVPLLLSAIPVEWIAQSTFYLPTIAGLLVLYPENSLSPLTPWQGLGVLAAWAAVAAIAAGVTFRYRDA